jgi:hypothetical protein
VLESVLTVCELLARLGWIEARGDAEVPAVPASAVAKVAAATTTTADDVVAHNASWWTAVQGAATAGGPHAPSEPPTAPLPLLLSLTDGGSALVRAWASLGPRRTSTSTLALLPRLARWLGAIDAWRGPGPSHAHPRVPAQGRAGLTCLPAYIFVPACVCVCLYVCVCACVGGVVDAPELVAAWGAAVAAVLAEAEVPATALVPVVRAMESAITATHVPVAANLALIAAVHLLRTTPYVVCRTLTRTHCSLIMLTAQGERERERKDRVCMCACVCVCVCYGKG